MARVSKKQYILESAASIINEQGADYLTLDASKKLVLVKVVYFIISKVKGTHSRA